MTDAMSLLKTAKTSADNTHADRDNYAAYVEQMREFGWTDADVSEYRAEVERIMKYGTEDEKRAASEFWSVKTSGCASLAGVNQRIKASIVADPSRKEAA